MDAESAAHRRSRAAPRLGHWLVQETSEAAPEGVCKKIVGAISGDAGIGLIVCGSSSVMPQLSLASTHCQRPNFVGRFAGRRVFDDRQAKANAS
jgi:hypothetical protein